MFKRFWTMFSLGASDKHERGWENSWQLCKPETKSRVCITVENSPNPSSINIRLCKYRENVFYCFYKSTSPRKNALLWHRLKKKFLSCTRTLARVISTCFAKTMTSKIRIFLALNVSLSEKKKKLRSIFVKIFQVSADEGLC